MKTIILTLAITFGFISTHSFAQDQDKKLKHQAEIKQLNDSIEYELLVFDSGFETFLAQLPYSMEFYSDDYYKNWNIRYVTEWNIRALNPARFGTFYENQIDYQSNVDYGLELNFKLYHYFLYIEEKYGIHLVQRK